METLQARMYEAEIELQNNQNRIHELERGLSEMLTKSEDNGRKLVDMQLMMNSIIQQVANLEQQLNLALNSPSGVREDMRQQRDRLQRMTSRRP